MSKEAKFIKDFDFLGFSRCFSLSIEQTSKNHPKMTQFGWILDVFEDCSILAEKQRLKPRKLNSLMNFASLDTQLDPQVARLAEWNESGVKKPSVCVILQQMIKAHLFILIPFTTKWKACTHSRGRNRLVESDKSYMTLDAKCWWCIIGTAKSNSGEK